ncbi:unnamed protein product, partial [Owenia fusiformis]
LQMSKVEKKEKDKGSSLSYMFRLPFAAGNVFSASMLDTLLYQAFIKDYIITFVRLLLGIDQALGSGHLSSMKITKDDLWIRTYGRLYQKLCSTTCEVPIGIYRTQPVVCKDSSNASLNCMDDDSDHGSGSSNPERAEISAMVTSRMDSMEMPVHDYDDVSDRRNSFSYCIINPSYDLKLEKDDIIYLIRPSSLSPTASPLIDERKMRFKYKREEPTGADKETSERLKDSFKVEMHDPRPTCSNDSEEGLCGTVV